MWKLSIAGQGLLINQGASTVTDDSNLLFGDFAGGNYQQLFWNHLAANFQFSTALGVNGGLSIGTSYVSTTSPSNGAIIQGNVGIGTTGPSEKLHVVGNLRVQGSTDCTLGNGSGGTNCSSDIRLKTNVQEIDNSLEKILSLRGVEFDWNEKSQSPGDHAIGVIAQDVEKQFPTAVIEDSNTGYKKVDYAVLVAPVIQAFKELNKRITELFSASEKHSRDIASVKAEKDKEIAELKARADNAETEAKKQKQENVVIKAYLCAKDPKTAICK
ncbi:MAG: tail fiber domain-containing protein [Bdellovibrionaceae bacterium]|nr:tail fiber domain-containing protein [Pseudobdellovibrionaceae bacterium]